MAKMTYSWVDVKEVIHDLYVVKNLPLKEVQNRLQKDHRFPAKTRILRAKIKLWDYGKRSTLTDISKRRSISHPVPRLPRSSPKVPHGRPSPESYGNGVTQYPASFPTVDHGLSSLFPDSTSTRSIVLSPLSGVEELSDEQNADAGQFDEKTIESFWGALKRNNVAEVERLLESPKGSCLLHHTWGYERTAPLSTVSGSPRLDGAKTLHVLAAIGMPEITRLIIRHGAEIEPKCSDKVLSCDMTALSIAAAYDHIDVIEALVEVGADTNPLGCLPPLQAAAFYGSRNASVALLDRHVAVNLKTDMEYGQCPKGSTALHYAVSPTGPVSCVEYYLWRKRLQVIDTLLEKGIDIHVQDTNGHTAFDVFMETLFQRPAREWIDINAVRDIFSRLVVQGASLFQTASLDADRECYAYRPDRMHYCVWHAPGLGLAERMAKSIPVKDGSKLLDTLMRLCDYAQVSPNDPSIMAIVKTLLERGMDPNSTDDDGRHILEDIIEDAPQRDVLDCVEAFMAADGAKSTIDTVYTAAARHFDEPLCFKITEKLLEKLDATQRPDAWWFAQAGPERQERFMDMIKKINPGRGYGLEHFDCNSFALKSLFADLLYLASRFVQLNPERFVKAVFNWVTKRQSAYYHDKMIAAIKNTPRRAEDFRDSRFGLLKVLESRRKAGLPDLTFSQDLIGAFLLSGLVQPDRWDGSTSPSAQKLNWGAVF